MPLHVDVTNAGSDFNYPTPFIGGPANLVGARVDVSAWATSAWVDDDGYLKPGAPGRVNAGLVVPIDATSQTAQYVNVEAVYLGAKKANLATVTDDFDIGFATGGDLNDGIMDEIKGSALSTDETNALDAGGFKLH